MRLIVAEELAQLSELQSEIDTSTKLLEPFKQSQEFERLNESLRREMEKTQKTLKVINRKKFKQNLADWEKDHVFDPTL